MKRRQVLKLGAAATAAAFMPTRHLFAAAKYRFGFSQVTTVEPWRVQFNKDMKKEAELHPFAVTLPPTGRSGSASTAPARSSHSSQCAVGVTGSRCALASTKMWLDTGSDAASACPIALSHPVIPPIFITSSIARSDAPAAIAFAMSRGNHQFSPVCTRIGEAARTRAWPWMSSAGTGSSTQVRS